MSIILSMIKTVFDLFVFGVFSLIDLDTDLECPVVSNN